MGKMGRFDLSGMKELQRSLEGLQKSSDAFVEGCAKELAARLLAMVVERTPVGVPPKHIADNKKATVEVVGTSGKKRKFLSREAEIYQKYWSGYSGGTLRKGWTFGDIENESGVYKIRITNPVEYASYVEYGHRQKPGKYVPALGKQLKKGWVKGHFMMTISEQELQSIAPQILEKRIQKFLGGALK